MVLAGDIGRGKKYSLSNFAILCAMPSQISDRKPLCRRVRRGKTGRPCSRGPLGLEAAPPEGPALTQPAGLLQGDPPAPRAPPGGHDRLVQGKLQSLSPWEGPPQPVAGLPVTLALRLMGFCTGSFHWLFLYSLAPSTSVWLSPDFWEATQD